MTSLNEKISAFVGVTGSASDVAAQFLDASNGKLEAAIDLFFASGGELDAPAPSNAVGTSTRRISRVKAEEEVDEDGVRKPIAPTQGTLVEASYEATYAPGRRRAVVPSAFESRYAANRNGVADAGTSARPDASSKRQSLAEMFRPPVDLIYQGMFEGAKDHAAKKRRWLLVNVQNVEEFACQKLNRDVFSNAAVRSLIRSNFILWQVYHDMADGRRFLTYYPITGWPVLAILDPRTGELMQALKQFDASYICELLTNFLADHQATLLSDDDESSEDAEEALPPAPQSLSRRSMNGSSSQHRLLTNSSMKRKQESSSSEDDSDAPPPPSSSKKRTKFEHEEAEGKALSRWKEFTSALGENVQVLVKVPTTGERRVANFTSLSKLKALFLYIEEEIGYDLSESEVVLNFPYRSLSELDPLTTLENAGVGRRETVYIKQIA